jgi:hypothetical protein
MRVIFARARRVTLLEVGHRNFSNPSKDDDGGGGGGVGGGGVGGGVGGRADDADEDVDTSSYGSNDDNDGDVHKYVEENRT